MGYTIAVLERAQARLASLPKPDRATKTLSNQDSIELLAKELLSALRRRAPFLRLFRCSHYPAIIKASRRPARVHRRSATRAVADRRPAAAAALSCGSPRERLLAPLRGPALARNDQGRNRRYASDL